MASSEKVKTGRRKFLRTAAIAGATSLIASVESADAQQAEATPAKATPAETPSTGSVVEIERPGADFMVDVLKTIGFDYVCSNPGSSFRGLHESVVNYGGNKSPEFLTCLHEEASVAMAHGYAKIEGKPLCVFAHGTVGLQHTAMAIYNAYCDRVPVYIILGNHIDSSVRAPGHWVHSVQDAAAMVRDFTKWDDLPHSLQHFAESAVRALKVAMTPPMGPVILVADSELQEEAIHETAKLQIPRTGLLEPPQGDSAAVTEVARLLLKAENPLIVVDRAARTKVGMARLIELAELLQAPVVDQNSRMNFPNRHPLNQSARRRGAIASADLILGLELADFWGTVNSFSARHRRAEPVTRPDVKLISISSGDLGVKGNYQNMQRLTDVDLGIAGDAEATLPALIEAVKRQMTASHAERFRDRGVKLAAAHHQAREQSRLEATYAWDASPISTARLSAEIWDVIKDEDWSLVSYPAKFSWWPQRMWTMDKYHHFIGGPGAFGEGYGGPAAVGAALANRKYGRLSVNIQNDGDLLYGPTVLWTAAHHRIPLLNIMHNNRAYHAEVLAVQRMANQHGRGIDQAGVGTLLNDPNVDFAKLAQSLGVYATGPITNPNDLSGAIRRAVDVVKRGEPALVDVITQPR